MTASVMAILATCLAPAAQATPVVGSMSLSSDGVIDNNHNLLTRSVFLPEGLHVGLRTGNFTLISRGTVIDGGVLDLNNLTNFTFDIPNQGTFLDLGIGNAIGTHTATNLDVVLEGVFTPEPNGLLGAFDAGLSTVRISLTRSGSADNFSISFSGTEGSQGIAVPENPPPAVPEPASLAVLLSGLVGLGLIRRRA